MSERIRLDIQEGSRGERTDTVIATLIPEVSRTLAQALVRNGRVLRNGIPAKCAQRVVPGDILDVELVLPPALSAAPEDVPLTIVYRDDDLAVIDKPAGLVVHPAPGHNHGTVANGLAALFPGAEWVGSAERPGIVHRLDKDTSGLMVVALRPSAHASLQRQIAQRTAGRRYLGLVGGCLSPDSGVIDAPVGRDPNDRRRMAAHGIAARAARTAYRTLQETAGFTLVEATLETGRTHQIRVHLAAIGHPIAGDRVYGGPALPGLVRQFLHAYRLTLRSPSRGETLQFESPLPPDLAHVLADLVSRSMC